MTQIVRLDPTRPLAAQAGVGHNRWHPGLAPVLTVEPGETFILETLDSSDGHLDAASTPADVLAFPVDRVHPLTGPVAVAGARPGMLLAIAIIDVVPRGPAISSLAPGEGALGHLIDAPVLAAVTLASVAADLEIAQLVNDPFPTVTCSLATDVFENRGDLRTSTRSTS